MKKITARHRHAVDLVVNEGRTQASVGREYGVTAGTIRRWMKAIYPPPPKQEMVDMYGSPIEIHHEYGSPFPQRYRDLNTNQRRNLREKYVDRFGGRCLYCGTQLDDEPHKFVRKSADDIEWDNMPGGKEAFLSNPIHLHHDQVTGLTLAPIHALCNAHSWAFYERSVWMEKLVKKVESLPPEKRKDLGARLRKRFS